MKALRRSHTSSSSSSPSASSSSWIHLRSLLILASQPVPDRGGLTSPWSRRKIKHALSRRQWNNLFTPEGKLRDGGAKLLKKVRSGGIDPCIRSEVWPFLLGVYNLDSSEAERNATKAQKRKAYGRLRKQCRWLLKPGEGNKELQAIGEVRNEDDPIYDEELDSPGSEEYNASISLFIEGDNVDDCSNEVLHENTPASNSCNIEEDQVGITHVDASGLETESSETESSVDDESETMPIFTDGDIEPAPKYAQISSLRRDFSSHSRTAEDFTTWQRIIRLDAIRANAEWVIYSPIQAEVSVDRARQSAKDVGLKDCDHMEPWRIYHAARLVAVLEAYALYDLETGYCQGMSDLLSPILAVMEEDDEAFWCFVGFMRKARHNFRLDEVGIRRQLNIVSKIIKSKDSHLYRHLEKLQAEDCFFVYRMVVVLFRRELTFDQTLCLWEVMWADQAAIRAGIGKSAWGRIRMRAPPTDDLLLYAIAACVLQKRKLIIERYSSMDEILRECNSMTGQLDVWKLLNDAHDLIVTLHEKI